MARHQSNDKRLDQTEPLWYNTIMARRYRPLIDGDDPKDFEWLILKSTFITILVVQHPVFFFCLTKLAF
jgi:hypothetical protein